MLLRVTTKLRESESGGSWRFGHGIRNCCESDQELGCYFVAVLKGNTIGAVDVTGRMSSES